MRSCSPRNCFSSAVQVVRETIALFQTGAHSRMNGSNSCRTNRIAVFRVGSSHSIGPGFSAMRQSMYDSESNVLPTRAEAQKVNLWTYGNCKAS